MKLTIVITVALFAVSCQMTKRDADRVPTERTKRIGLIP